MPRPTPLFALALAACTPDRGDDSGAGSSACPEISGETHLATESSSPDGLSLMLHLVGLSCPVVGQDGFHLYPSGDMDSGLGSASDDVTISAVEAIMPDMGHGSTQDPEVDSGDPSRFDAWFQMAGSWRLTVTCAVADVDAAQTVSYDLDVVEP